MPTVTFLFTDIEGSTRMWASHPDAMQSALARHDELMRSVVGERRGRIFKHTGDGIAAVFGSARDAVIAATDIQRRLATEHLAEIGTLRVRVGVHAGEAAERDGDYFGIAVNRAARIMDAGHGGQILASSVAVGLAGEAATFRELGTFRLADLTEPERIFQVVVDDLDGEHPPLRTLDRALHNLPVFVSSFVGRDQERAQLGDLIGVSRLVTVTGVGGSGKTRLSLHVVADLVGEYPDGVWLVELAPVADPALVDDAVLTTLGVPRSDDRSARDLLIEFVRAKTMLLVIDNCEHVIGAAASLVDDVLSHAVDVRVVATSRELLGVPGETAFGLRSLAVPPGGADIEVVRKSDSVRLFEERAAAVRSGFTVEASSAAAVTEICRRLDGMPLAIELAAARIRSFDPSQIAEHLDQRFRLLTGGSRTALPRQQTLTATIEWSYRLLDEPERALFRRLSVFQGGFAFKDVEAICCGDPVDRLTLLELFPALVDKSLVNVDTDPSGTRYRMLESIRQYARDRLDDTDDGDSWRRRHAEHYASVSGSATTEALNGPGGPDTVARLLADADNIRQAVTWSVDAGFGGIAADAIYGLSRVLVVRGAWSEVIDRCEAILEMDLADSARARTLGLLAAALIPSSRRSEGIELLRRAIDLYRALDRRGTSPEDLADFSRTLINFGYLHFLLGEAGEHNERFTEILEEALAVARRFGQSAEEAIALSNLAHHRDPRGPAGVTRERFDEAEEAAARSGFVDPRHFGSQRGFFEFDQGELDVAQKYFESNLEVAHESQSADVPELEMWIEAMRALRGETDDRFRASVRKLYSDPERRSGAAGLTTCLGFGACIDSSKGDHLRVAVAHGAIEALPDTLRWDLRSAVARALERARDALGDGPFEEAFARGKRMRSDDAILFVANPN